MQRNKEGEKEKLIRTEDRKREEVQEDRQTERRFLEKNKFKCQRLFVKDKSDR